MLEVRGVLKRFQNNSVQASLQCIMFVALVNVSAPQVVKMMSCRGSSYLNEQCYMGLWKPYPKTPVLTSQHRCEWFLDPERLQERTYESKMMRISWPVQLLLWQRSSSSMISKASVDKGKVVHMDPHPQTELSLGWKKVWWNGVCNPSSKSNKALHHFNKSCRCMWCKWDLF